MHALRYFSNEMTNAFNLTIVSALVNSIRYFFKFVVIHVIVPAVQHKKPCKY